ncbi:MAG: FkbM family methyltransferase [Proteobacteria bacterium]|jgi:FkbM family methyltransferase|nr:FkbM family methyltransferase [Pseudomonadota bacterium]
MKIAWSIPNVGPYHHARYSKLAAAEDIDLDVIEVASKMGRYPWNRTDDTNYKRITLFENAVMEDLPGSLVTLRMMRQLAKIRPDVVVVTGYSNQWDRVSAAWARVTRKTSLTTFVTTELDHPRKRSVETAKSFLLRSLFDGVACTGQRSKEYLLKLGVKEERIQVCGNVVDNDHFAAPRELSNPALPQGPYFLSVTRFSPEKNLPAMLDAYEDYCRNSNPAPWPLVMCGSGPQDAEVRARAARLNAGKVIFPGFLGYDALPEVYQRAGCMLLPSLSEPWGLVVNEAMAAGTPVIVSNRCGCVPDLVEHGENGFVFDPNDTSELTMLMKKVASLSDDERLEMGRKGQNLIVGYTPDTWANSLLELVGGITVLRKRNMRTLIENLKSSGMTGMKKIKRRHVARLKRYLEIAQGNSIFIQPEIWCEKKRFGSQEYGGWDVAANGIDADSVVYSFGVGEDASFDIELIERYGITIHAFDPTPRSIEWVDKQRFPSKFIMHEFGIAAFDGLASFHPPENPEHVSHTMLDRPSTMGKVITVPVKRLVTIMNELGHNNVDILKMDIEGAEYNVIGDLENSNIRPKQILVEFHHRFPGIGMRKTKEAIKKLRLMGYLLFSVSNEEEYCFLRRDIYEGMAIRY